MNTISRSCAIIWLISEWFFFTYSWLLFVSLLCSDLVLYSELLHLPAHIAIVKVHLVLWIQLRIHANHSRSLILWIKSAIITRQFIFSVITRENSLPYNVLCCFVEISVYIFLFSSSKAKVYSIMRVPQTFSFVLQSFIYIVYIPCTVLTYLLNRLILNERFYLVITLWFFFSRWSFSQ